MQRVAGQQPREAVLAALIEEVPDAALSDSLVALVALPEHVDALEAATLVGTSGRTSQSVALALFLGCSPSSIDVAFRDALRCGGDTGTIGSLAAQLRAACGAELPRERLPHLPTDDVRDLSALLARRGEGRSKPRRRRWGLF